MVIALSTNNLSNTAKTMMPEPQAAALGSAHGIPCSCLKWWSWGATLGHPMAAPSRAARPVAPVRGFRWRKAIWPLWQRDGWAENTSPALQVPFGFLVLEGKGGKQRWCGDEKLTARLWRVPGFWVTVFIHPKAQAHCWKLDVGLGLVFDHTTQKFFCMLGSDIGKKWLEKVLWCWPPSKLWVNKHKYISVSEKKRKALCVLQAEWLE